MRRWLPAAALGAPFLLGLALVGCGRPKDDMDYGGGGQAGGAPVTAAPATLTPIPGKAGAVLKGRVKIEGAPDLASLNRELQEAMSKKPDDKASCFDLAPPDEKTQQEWALASDGSGGVGNVVVWIQPPTKDYYFAVDPNDMALKTWDDVVRLDQPHCVFVPHVLWAMPTVFNPDDPHKPIPSGQKFLVSNSAAVTHNTTYKAQIGSLSGEVGTLPAGKKDMPVELKGNNALVQFSCNIHPWMQAYVWVFNHPYAAITKPDGTFEIKNVPVGSKVKITAWHEKGPYGGFLTQSAIRGDEIELKDDVTVHDFPLPVGGK